MLIGIPEKKWDCYIRQRSGINMDIGFVYCLSICLLACLSLNKITQKNTGEILITFKQKIEIDLTGNHKRKVG